jgi:hypothetical protein
MAGFHRRGKVRKAGSGQEPEPYIKCIGIRRWIVAVAFLRSLRTVDGGCPALSGVVLWVLHRYKRLLKIHNRHKSAYPGMFPVLIFPSFMLAVRGAADFPLLHYTRIWIPVLILSQNVTPWQEAYLVLPETGSVGPTEREEGSFRTPKLLQQDG